MNKLTKEQLKDEVIQMVMEGDEELLKVFYDIGNDLMSPGFDEILEKAELQRRRTARLEGSSKIYTWVDVRNSLVESLKK